MFKQLPLSTKINMLIFAIIVLFSMILVWTHKHVKERMYDGKYLKTRHVTEAVFGILEYFSEKAEKGTMRPKEARQMAMEIISRLRYEQEDYF